MPFFPNLKLFRHGIERVYTKDEGRFEGSDYRAIMKVFQILKEVTAFKKETKQTPANCGCNR